MNRSWLVVLLLWCALVTHAADLNDLAVQAKLAQGEIVVDLEKESGTHVLVGTATGVIDAPREQVWQVIGDFNHFTEFMPSFKASFMLQPDAMSKLDPSRNLKDQEPELRAYKADTAYGDSLLIYHCFDFPFPLGDRRCIIHMVRDGTSFKEHYDLVTGDFNVDEGWWELRSYGENRTLAIYKSRTDPKLSVPGFLLKIGTKSVLPDVIKGVRKRVKEKH